MTPTDRLWQTAANHRRRAEIASFRGYMDDALRHQRACDRAVKAARKAERGGK